MSEERPPPTTPPPAQPPGSAPTSASKSWLPWRRQATPTLAATTTAMETPPTTPPFPALSSSSSSVLSPLPFTAPSTSTSSSSSSSATAATVDFAAPAPPPPALNPQLDVFAMEIQRLISCSNLQGVLDLLLLQQQQLDVLPPTATAAPQPQQPDSRFASVLLDVLCFLADQQQEQEQEKPSIDAGVAVLRRWLDLIADHAAARQQPTSTFLRGFDSTVLVRLLCVPSSPSPSTTIRQCAMSLFTKLFALTNKPWSLAHKEKRLALAEAFFVSIPPPTQLSPQWCEALELFFQSSLLNPTLVSSSLSGDAGAEDEALAYFELEGGYELVLQRVEDAGNSPPELVDALIDLLRGLTYLGGSPREFQAMYRLSVEENSLEAISEAKNMTSFTCICRLVSKMLETPSFPSSTIRLPVLHAIMSVFEANPKNFGILERRFQLLSQLSRHLGQPELHDELLFMCVKLFELVGLGFEYRPISAVTALCDSAVLPAIAQRGDERTFAVLANTLCKLVSRHPSLAVDSGLMRNVIAPIVVIGGGGGGAMVPHALSLLAACLERHSTNCSQSAKPVVFENNCAAARTAHLGVACKDLVLSTSKGGGSEALTSAALHVVFLLAKDVNGDLQLMLELLQSRSTVQFRTVVFEQCLEVVRAHDDEDGQGGRRRRKRQQQSGGIWSQSGVAIFDCVLTVLLSLESAFVEVEGKEAEFQLLIKSLLFLHQSFKHGNVVDYDSLFPVLNLSGVLQCPRRAPEFVRFLFREVLLDPLQQSHGGDTEIDYSEPMVLLGCLTTSSSTNNKADLLALTMLRDLVAHDGESAAWNRQQVAKIRGAEKLVQCFAHALQDPEHELHPVLVQIVGCVGNFAATPELLDSLLRLAYRSAPDDDVAQHEEEEEEEGKASAAAAAALECVLEVLKLVSEPKAAVGRHVVLNAAGETPVELVPAFRTWPPPLAGNGGSGSPSGGGGGDVSYSLSTWFSLPSAASATTSKHRTLFTLYSASVLLLSVVLERIVDGEDEEGDSPDETTMGLGIPKYAVVVSTSSGQCRLLAPHGVELFPARWHHLVLVHRRSSPQRGGGVSGGGGALSAFWKSNASTSSSSSPPTTGSAELLPAASQGTVELFLNGERLALDADAAATLAWPSQVTDASVVQLGWPDEQRLWLGRTLLFEGALRAEMVAGLFLRGPAYRGSLNKASPLFQDKKATLTCAFERLHFLARDDDDDFFARIDAAAGGWMDIQRFVSAALGARTDCNSAASKPAPLVQLVFQFDPEDVDHADGGGLRLCILPQPIQDTMCSFGGATVALLPLLLRVGRQNVCAVLTVVRDSLRASERARFLFRFDDGHRVLAWLLHLVLRSGGGDSSSEVFHCALTASTIGTGFDAALVDAEQLAVVMMNHHVWRRHSESGSGSVAWDLVGDLLAWLSKLLHVNNRHRLVNFAVLHTIHVFDWVFGCLVMLLEEEDEDAASAILAKCVGLLESLLRCDLDFVGLVFDLVLALSGGNSGEEDEDLDSLLRKARGAREDGEAAAAATHAAADGRRHVTLSAVRCALLELLVRLRTPRPRASAQEAQDHARLMSSLYVKHCALPSSAGASGWLWCVLSLAAGAGGGDLASLLRVLAFVEKEIAVHADFKMMLAGVGKPLCVLADALGDFANASPVVLLWARLCTGCTEGDGDGANENRADVDGDDDDVEALRQGLYAVLTLPGFGKFGSLNDVAFATCALEAACQWLRHNLTATTDRRRARTVNALFFRFLWSSSQASSGLTKLWTTAPALRVLVKTLFAYEAAAAARAVEVDEDEEPFGPFELLLDLVVWSASPGDTFALACNSFPAPAGGAVSLADIQRFQLKLFLGCVEHAQINVDLARVMVQRCCVGWVPGLEHAALDLCSKGSGQEMVPLARALVLSVLDRTATGSADETELLARVRAALPSLLLLQSGGGDDVHAFVGCVLRCVFPAAFEQANAAMQGQQAEEREFAWWALFIAVCRLAPDSVRRLYATASSDMELARAQELASSTLNSETRMDWILAHMQSNGPLRSVFAQSCYAAWLKDVDNKHGKWHVAGRAATLHLLVESTLRTTPQPHPPAGAAASSSLSKPLLGGWGAAASTSSLGAAAAAAYASASSSLTGRSAAVSASAQQQVQQLPDHAKQASGQAKRAAFQRLEQLFSSKTEDLLRGEKSWTKVMRRSTLPNLPWEPFGGRDVDEETRQHRWKLDPFEDPQRQRRRLRLNRTFYQRYNLEPSSSSTPSVAAVKQQPDGAAASPSRRKRALSVDSASTPSPRKSSGAASSSPVVATLADRLDAENTAAASPGLVLAFKKKKERKTAALRLQQQQQQEDEEDHGESRVRTQTLISGGDDEDDDVEDGRGGGEETTDDASAAAAATATSTSSSRPSVVYIGAHGGDDDDLATLESDDDDEGSRAIVSDDDDEEDNEEEDDEYVMIPTSSDAAVAAELAAKRRRHASLQERVRSALDPADWDAPPPLRVNCSTVRGLEERTGLCIVARTSLYVLDNYQVRSGAGGGEDDGDGLGEGEEGGEVLVELEEHKSRFHIQVRHPATAASTGDCDNASVSTTTGHSAAGAQMSATSANNNNNASPPASASVSSTPHHRSRRVRHDEIVDVLRRRFLFRDVGLEIFSSTGATLFVVFATGKERDRVQLELKKARRKSLFELPFASSSSSSSSNSGKLRQQLTLQDAKRQWVAGQLSNFDYLMLLNTLAGRSLNDAAQYMVFPWILRDYESSQLDLSGAERVFRDLSKPMGAMTPERVQYAMDRYAHLDQEANNSHVPAFHFGSHYSCSGYVANYLIRLEPFSRMALQLQGGQFDHPDRLFRSIDQTWKSASGASMQDVRELVPEFFIMHEFLVNMNQFELGTTHRGVTVDDVELPAWANGSALEFVRLHRKALESPYVSQHLNEWIDLVFGYKQRGREAIKAVNVFHPLTYEGAVDLDAIEDATERASAMEQIHSFGQTPKRLFDSAPHPKREQLAPAERAPLIVAGSADRGPGAGVVQSAWLLAAAAAADFATPGECQMVLVDDGGDAAPPLTVMHASSGPVVCEMMWDDADRLVVLRQPPPPRRSSASRQARSSTALFVTPTRYVTFGDRDGSLRIYSCYTTTTTSSSSSSTNLSSAASALDQVTVAFEDLHRGRIACAFVVDGGKQFVTGGGEDGAVSVWRLRKHPHDGSWRLEHEATGNGHLAASGVTCLAVCKEQGMAVSGAEDGSATVWDWGKRLEYVRALKPPPQHGKPLRFVGVNAANGNVVTVCEREARVWHVNGQLLACGSEFRNLRLSAPTSCLVVPCAAHVPGIVLVLGHQTGETSLWDLTYPADHHHYSAGASSSSRGGAAAAAATTRLELRAVLPPAAAPMADADAEGNAVVSLAMSRDGRVLVAATARGELRRWMTSDALLKRIKTQQSSSASLAAHTLKTLVARNSSILGGGGGAGPPQQQQQQGGGGEAV